MYVQMILQEPVHMHSKHNSMKICQVILTVTYRKKLLYILVFISKGMMLKARNLSNLGNLV